MVIEPEHFLEELLHCVKKRDSIKVSVLMRHFNELDASMQRRVVFELSRADDLFSVPLLIDLAVRENINTEVRLSLKNVLLSKFLSDLNTLNSALINPEYPKKHLLIEIAGEIESESVFPALSELLNSECSEEDTNEIIRALGCIGEITVNTLSEFLYSRNRVFIMTAVDALKEVANKTAVQRLAERMGTDDNLDLYIIDALADIQDQYSIQKLNACLLSHHAIIRNYAKKKLVKLNAKSVPILIDNLNSPDVDLLIHSLNVLAVIKDDSSVVPIKKLLHRQPEDPNVRFAAYEALGDLPLGKHSYVLTAGFADTVDNVCAVAVQAINRNYNDLLAVGIKNIVADPQCNLNRVVTMVIDSMADRIFVDLLEVSVFKRFAIAYLKNKAHHDVKAFFSERLRQFGHTDIVEQIAGAATKGDRIKVVAVDDSRMILSLYKSALYRMGFEPHLYEFPQSALDALESIKPQLIITDLNMPDITGIELTRKIRESFSVDTLPVIMVTTQHEVQDNKAAEKAGVNKIIHKPFTDETLLDAINSVMAGDK